ncbi:MAG: DUF4286 family protein [Odoribacteraceae bacterium]|jgi:hypothetical protein|nr:DUF4286 family protein [Odoribacteraceae bacterium]
MTTPSPRRVVHNTTFHVDEAVETAWLAALLDEVVPAVTLAAPLARSLFTRVRVGDDACRAYSLQLLFDDDDACRRLALETMGEWLDALSRRFPGGFHHFCSTLEEVRRER